MVFRIWNFKSYKPGSFKRNIFAFLIKKFSAFLKLGSTGFLTVLIKKKKKKKKIHDIIIEVNFLIIEDGLYKNVLTF